MRTAFLWERIYAITNFLAGLSDDLGHEAYRSAMEELAGAQWRPADACDETLRAALIERLRRIGPPAIYSGTGKIERIERADPAVAMGIASDEALAAQIEKTMGFRFLGQRFAPDAYWMGRLVFPTVGAPTGQAWTHSPQKPATWERLRSGPPHRPAKRCNFSVWLDSMRENPLKHYPGLSILPRRAKLT